MKSIASSAQTLFGHLSCSSGEICAGNEQMVIRSSQTLPPQPWCGLFCSHAGSAQISHSGVWPWGTLCFLQGFVGLCLVTASRIWQWVIFKKWVYDTIDSFSRVIVRMCIKTLTCEPVTADLSAEMSLSNSLVQQDGLKERVSEISREHNLVWSGPPETMKGRAIFKARSIPQGLVKSDFENLQEQRFLSF